MTEAWLVLLDEAQTAFFKAETDGERYDAATALIIASDELQRLGELEWRI